MPKKEPYIEIKKSGRVKKPGASLVFVYDSVTAGSDACTTANGPAGTSGNPDLWLTIWYDGAKYVIPAWKPTTQTD